MLYSLVFSRIIALKLPPGLYKLLKMGCSSSKPDETQELAPQRITGLENNNDSTPPVRNTVGLGAQSQKSPGTSGPTSKPRNPSWHPPPAQIGIDVLHDDNNADIEYVITLKLGFIF